MSYRDIVCLLAKDDARAAQFCALPPRERLNLGERDDLYRALAPYCSGLQDRETDRPPWQLGDRLFGYLDEATGRVYIMYCRPGADGWIGLCEALTGARK
jgi:hypothetical protein